MFVVPGTGLFENAMTRYGIILHPSAFILHPSLHVLRASFSCVSKKAATEIRDRIKHCDFFTNRFARVHGDK
jgi:hypothetical protein